MNTTDLFNRAEYGDLVAQYNIGLMYFLGDKFEQDILVSTYWFKKAANKGDRKSQSILGNIYYFGRGNVEKNNSNALYWFKKAAENNDATAQYYLGEMYEGGIGVHIDYDLAKYWFRKAVDNGETRGNRKLTLMKINKVRRLANEIYLKSMEYEKLNFMLKFYPSIDSAIKCIPEWKNESSFEPPLSGLVLNVLEESIIKSICLGIHTVIYEEIIQNLDSEQDFKDFNSLFYEMLRSGGELFPIQAMINKKNAGDSEWWIFAFTGTEFTYEKVNDMLFLTNFTIRANDWENDSILYLKLEDCLSTIKQKISNRDGFLPTI
ncbi:hypothetical protein BCM0100_p220 (plasmid) [Bacillus cereus]|uniref:tetratricopeptide repeat protein n=1 Tax=Bacillus cereus TaxID=1396 RepID=UPI001F2713F1|nr:tetratricopeptide repeat protein [Bacillus cereus]BCC32967.1 hypothetical protein BCM0100_p220 [Bacillus cereus]